MSMGQNCTIRNEHKNTLVSSPGALGLKTLPLGLHPVCNLFLCHKHCEADANRGTHPLHLSDAS